MSDAVQSPCIGYCRLNEQQICAGCFRRIDEITGWRDKPQAEKRNIIQRCAERKLIQPS
ncbi:DUF1289 domain-containing protein [Oceanimonas baumannii]|uniref:DUF1289 domain-containing protein n=1 Tax=Oceanimonas baumannii TaxID=129578 RepID=UPI001D1860B6|nr:DUF1289 domain-containing protein [Oceanimonas baumannii]MCC4264227.1 DUF1289 domain-containing protein [Oceanimonas baumannii]